MYHPNGHLLPCFKIVGCDPLVGHGKKFAGKGESELIQLLLLSSSSSSYLLLLLLALSLLLVGMRNHGFLFVDKTFHFLSHYE